MAISYEKICHEMRYLMAYRKITFSNVRFYRCLGTLWYDCGTFVVPNDCFAKNKLNKIKGFKALT